MEVIIDVAEIWLTTTANGDRICIQTGNISAEGAAELAGLINTESQLKVEITAEP